jgi:sugar phosphate isomerase/epimerase
MKQGLVEQNMAALKPLVEMAGDLKLTLVLENFKAPFDTVSVFQTLVEEGPGQKIHLDAGHTHMGRDSAETFCQHLGPHIVHVHLSDNRGTGDHHMPLGAGNVDWPEIIKALQKIGYDDTITLEVFCGSQPVLFDYLETSRRYLQELWG